MEGLLPPQATEIEEIILGACMIDPAACSTAIELMKPEMFYKQENKIVFGAIESIYKTNKPIDILTVTEEVRRVNHLEYVGGAYYIQGLTNRVASGTNAHYHCLIIQQKYFLRELIKICNDATNEAYQDSGDCLNLIDSTAKEILSICDIQANPNAFAAKRVERAINEIQAAMQTGNTITGISSGINELDRITAGWQNQDLIVIAARPGAGKSALAINIAAHAARTKTPTWFFSLEMSDTQIAMRELANTTRLKYSHLRKGQVHKADFEQLIKLSEPISTRPLFVDSSSSLSISILRKKLIKAIREHGIKLAVIDYLNLMESETRSYNTADKISEIVKELKRMAKQLNIPIILLAQLNRDVEKEEGNRPRLHHLKSSGAIEEYSDMVLLLYRPAYYHRDPNTECPEPNTLYIDIAKHKQGATGEVKCYCEIEKNIITDWQDTPMPHFRPLKIVSDDQPF